MSTSKLFNTSLLGQGLALSVLWFHNHEPIQFLARKVHGVSKSRNDFFTLRDSLEGLPKCRHCQRSFTRFAHTLMSNLHGRSPWLIMPFSSRWQPTRTGNLFGWMLTFFSSFFVAVCSAIKRFFQLKASLGITTMNMQLPGVIVNIILHPCRQPTLGHRARHVGRRTTGLTHVLCFDSLPWSWPWMRRIPRR